MTVPENPSKVLEAQLAQRPDVQDLIDRNIIKDPKVAPAIQQQRDELEKRKIEDSLRHKIDHRPSPEALVEQNILKDPKIAPSLQRHQHDLERNILQDKLEHKIQGRPNPVELVEQGILTGFLSRGRGAKNKLIPDELHFFKEYFRVVEA